MSTEHESTDVPQPATTLEAEGARIAIISCAICGAAVMLDPREEFDARRKHDEWHAEAYAKAVMKAMRDKPWEVDPADVSPLVINRAVGAFYDAQHHDKSPYQAMRAALLCAGGVIEEEKPDGS